MHKSQHSQRSSLYITEILRDGILQCLRTQDVDQTISICGSAHLLALCPWTRFLTSLCLSFPYCRIEIIIVSSPKGILKERNIPKTASDKQKSLKKYEILFHYLVNIEHVAKCKESANQPVQEVFSLKLWHVFSLTIHYFSNKDLLSAQYKSALWKLVKIW